jgi:hypothetical protein
MMLKVLKNDNFITALKYSRIFILASTELSIESGNVYTEKKRGFLYSFFDASPRGHMAGKSEIILTNPDFPAIRPRRNASKKLYKDPHFFSSGAKKFYVYRYEQIIL